MLDMSAPDEDRTMGQAILSIDLGALADNWRLLAERAKSAANERTECEKRCSSHHLT